MAQVQGAYYVPHGTRWPILGSFGLFFTVGGAGLWLNEVDAVASSSWPWASPVCCR